MPFPPRNSIVSLLYVMADGASAEIAVIGNEGAIGVALFMGGETTPSRAIVQSAGSAYRLDSKRLKVEFNRHGQMLHLLRYTQALITQMAQTAVCNRHHSVDQQLCRWLLLSLDRLPSNELVQPLPRVIHHCQESFMHGVLKNGVAALASYDLATQRRVHPAKVLGGSFRIAMWVASATIANSEWGQAIVRGMP